MAQEKAKAKGRKIGRGKRGLGLPYSESTRARNKARKAATHAAHLVRAAERRVSPDYTFPENVLDVEGKVKHKAGSLARRKTNIWHRSIFQRLENCVKIEKKRDQRRKFAELDKPMQRYHTVCGRLHTKPLADPVRI